MQMLKILFRFEKVINFYFALLEEVASQSVSCAQDSLGRFKFLKNADADMLILLPFTFTSRTETAYCAFSLVFLQEADKWKYPGYCALAT